MMRRYPRALAGAVVYLLLVLVALLVPVLGPAVVALGATGAGCAVVSEVSHGPR